MNGYVAVAALVRKISTKKRDCVAVQVQAGYLKWDDSESGITSNFRRLYTVEQSDEGGSPSSILNPYSAEGQYVGISKLEDPLGLRVSHIVAASNNALVLSICLEHPETATSTAVDWTLAIENILLADHVSQPLMTSFAEESLANHWKTQNIWSTIRMVNANGRFDRPQISPIRYISRTTDNEELRFFLASRRATQRFLIRHRQTPIVKCIQIAIAGEKVSEEEQAHLGLRDADFYGSKTQEPWLLPSAKEELRSPGWIIIS